MPRPVLLPSLAVLFAFVLTDRVAQGASCRDVSFPEQVTVDGRTLALNGIGVRKATILRVEVYVAALYAATPSKEPSQISSSGIFRPNRARYSSAIRSLTAFEVTESR